MNGSADSIKLSPSDETEPSGSSLNKIHFPSTSMKSRRSIDERESYTGRSRGRGTSLQSRRSTIGTLGLGSSFAFPASTPEGAVLDGSSYPSRSNSTSGADSLVNGHHPYSHSHPHSHSGHNSISTTVTPPSQLESLSLESLDASISSTSRPTTATSMSRPSRRPSLSHLASFLSGIEHHTRVRTPGVEGGRGVSRSASRSTSRVGGGRSRQNSVGSERDSSRASSFSGSLRRGSISSVANIAMHDDIQDKERSWEEEESFSTATPQYDLSSSFSSNSYAAATPTTASFSAQAQSQRHIFHSPAIPRVLPTSTNEEPFLDTAPSSPIPRHLQYTPASQPYPSHSSADSQLHPSDFYQPYHHQSQQYYHDKLLPASSLEDVDVFEEGDRVGVGIWLEERGGWVRDCFAEGEDELGGRATDGDGRLVVGAPTEMEVVRRLGEGTYAIVYLVREVLYDPPDEDCLSPLDSSFMFDSVASISSLSYQLPTAAISPSSSSPPANGIPLIETKRPRYRSWSSDPFTPAIPIYGRSFALKCLCKKDLSEELVEVQRGEAVLHRALPEHEYIVRLYGAYETDDWLFLVLEYCPGQDLFYWLDERRDDSVSLYGSRATSPFQPVSSSTASSIISAPDTSSYFQSADSISMDRRSIEEGGDETEDEDMFSRTITQSTGAALMSAAHKANTDTRPKLDLTNHLLQSRAQRESPSASTATTAASTSAQTGDTWFSTSSDQTPPSPSLLSSTLNEALLSRKRLRLISRMFGQMCAAVAACHDVGVAHRDIKPENFIVMDGRGESGEGKKEGARVVVKITDWGLGTRELECEDFDCGSKPYMAYECRNNLQPTYDPRQADVWSLGLVLLNLLFHRNPWADPSLDDLDFADYVRDPIAFLKDRFEGIGTEVATFLTDRVFCDVLEMESDGKMRRRATAGEFGKWSSRLVTMMGEGRRRKASVSEHTIELTSTSSRAGGVILSGVNGSLSPLSMDDNFERMDEIVEEGLMKDAVTFSDSAPAPTTIQSPSTFIINNIESPTSNLRLSSLSIMKPTSTFNFDDLDSTLPSPSFPPSSLPLYATLAPAPSASPSLLSDMLRQSTPSPSGTPIDQAAPPRILRTTTDTQSRTISASPSAPLISPLPASTISISSTTPAPSSPPVLSNDSTEASAEEETATETLKAKRRKRGIRKGKGGAKSLEIDSSSALSLVPSSLEILPAIDTNHDRVLADLAAASQDLARELSNTKTTLKSSCFGTQSASAIALTSSYPANKIGQNAAGMEAFKQRAESKNSSFGNSAPAKMQNHRVDRTWASANTESNGSRTGAIGTASWGSEMESGPSSIGIDPGHWSSASSRRDRLDKQRIRPGLGLSPPSSSATITRVNGISNSNVISANNTTAATTFTTGFDALFSHGHSRSVEQDWRHTTSAAEKPVKSVPSAPTFKTKVIDMPSASPSTTLAPSPLYKAENDQYRPPHQRNGLSKLLQGITVFNRSNERKTKD